MSALPEHLRNATTARTEQATTKARAAIRKLVGTRQPVTFVAVSRAAEVSTDFLYRHADLRSQIERHRSTQGHRAPAAPGPDDPAAQSSSAVRALARRLDEERGAHRETVAQLRKALEVAHGENLKLRRRLAAYEPE